jgi:hypothetical protein
MRKITKPRFIIQEDEENENYVADIVNEEFAIRAIIYRSDNVQFLDKGSKSFFCEIAQCFYCAELAEIGTLSKKFDNDRVGAVLGNCIKKVLILEKNKY